MGPIEFHTWNADLGNLDRPDRMIFDLDPDPVLPWSRMVEATQLVLALLDELGLRAFLKTSGGKGMHVVVPQRFTDRMGPQNRVKKIYVDYLRNQKGGTTVAAYSVRARSGLGVSVPVTQDEIVQLSGSATWTTRNPAEHLETLTDNPWVRYAPTQRITQAMMGRLGLK